MGQEITIADAAEEASTSTNYEQEGEMPDAVKWASESLILHQDNTNSDDEDAVADLLADLMHYCEHHGLDFEGELRRGSDSYTYEQGQG